MKRKMNLKFYAKSMLPRLEEELVIGWSNRPSDESTGWTFVKGSNSYIGKRVHQTWNMTIGHLILTILTSRCSNVSLEWLSYMYPIYSPIWKSSSESKIHIKTHPWHIFAKFINPKEFSTCSRLFSARLGQVIKRARMLLSCAWFK